MAHLPFKNIPLEIRLIHTRSLMAMIFIVLCFLLLFARLYYLAIDQHDYYRTLAAENHTRHQYIDAERGLIVDRKGVVLASNKSVFSLDVIPAKVTDLPQAFTALTPLVHLTPHMLSQFSRARQQASNQDEIPLKLSLTDEERATFAVNQYRFPGFILRARVVRDYPLGALTANVIGYVGRTDAQGNDGLPTFIGKSGLEKSFDSVLRGKPGVRTVQVNPAGHVLRTLSTTPAIPGDTLTLTIDSRLQRAAHLAFGDVRGGLVAIDPTNGDILAMVSSPSFDPNGFIDGMSDAQYAQLATHGAFLDRTLRSTYPPASTIKPFIALAGLSTHTITADTTIDDPGYFILPNSTHRFHDWIPGGHGRVSLTKAITVSCDTYFYSLANQLGIANMHTLLDAFGFGKLTGIDIPGEQTGLLPSPAWKRAHTGTSWYPGDTLVTGIGQGYLSVTPLQLASATAAMSMHGARYTPHILATTSITPLSPVVLSEDTAWQTVITAMQAVIEESNGTGFRFGRHAAYSVAGKTGTAQVISTTEQQRFKNGVPNQYQNNSLFIAFAPIDHPRIAIAVIAEHSIIAPAIARAVMDAYLGESS